MNELIVEFENCMSIMNECKELCFNHNISLSTYKLDDDAAIKICELSLLCDRLKEGKIPYPQNYFNEFRKLGKALRLASNRYIHTLNRIQYDILDSSMFIVQGKSGKVVYSCKATDLAKMENPEKIAEDLYNSLPDEEKN
jgi:hypothetical protein